MPEPDSVQDRDPKSSPDPPNQPLVDGKDFYREGPYVVFTEAYHLRRGYCCGSGCRHCPWREKPSEESIGESP